MKLSFDKNKFVLQTSAFVTNLPGWQNEVGGFSTTDIKVAARLRTHADAKAENIFKVFMLRDLTIPPGGPLSPKGMELFPFQKRGVAHILQTSKTYLAHQPGLGKTAQAICAVNMKPGQTLVIVPSFLKTTWAREITKWSNKDFPSIQVVPETSKQTKIDWTADYIICSDAMLLKEWVYQRLHAREFKFVFIDEAHRFKTPTAARTLVLFGGRNKEIQSQGLIYKSEHVSMLSGTPLLNRPIELWPMLYAMAPELIDFMSYQDFGFRYGGAVMDDRGYWRFIGSAHEEELNKRIMGRFMQRVTKEDVLPDLPKKVRQVIFMGGPDPRKSDVQALDKECQLKLTTKKLDESNSLGDYAIVRHENGLAKVDWAAQYVTETLKHDRNESIILFAHHRDVVAQLAVQLFAFNPLVINGGVPDETRTKYQDLFQSGKRRLIIGNIDSMNLGITLTRATRVVFAEYSWTPAINEQAEDRANRIGSKWSVFCQYIVLPNSIDEVILNRVLEKEEKIGRVLA